MNVLLRKIVNSSVGDAETKEIEREADDKQSGFPTAACERA
jgi:hypothetical protein